MAIFLELFKRWESYPSIFASVITPWVQPFRALGWINTNWQPEIDVAANVVTLVYLLYIVGGGFLHKSAPQLRSSLLWATVVALLSGLGCYLMSSHFIHQVDADWVYLVNVPWAVAYVLMFAALLKAVFAVLLLVGR